MDTWILLGVFTLAVTGFAAWGIRINKLSKPAADLYPSTVRIKRRPPWRRFWDWVQND